jgi:hypothetical protein
MGGSGKKEEDVNQSAEGHHPFATGLRWLGYVSAVLLFYILSTGPAVKLATHFDTMNKHPRAEQVMEAFYRPLAIIVDHSPLAQGFFFWYLGRIWRIPIPPMTSY